MALNDTLGTALTAVTNPDPNGLATKAPYALAESRKNPPFTPSSAWTAQAKPALFPIGVLGGEGDKRIWLHFIPSNGAAVTYTATVWFYNPVSNTWVKPKNSPTISYTGEAKDYIDNPGCDAIFIELSSISAGTISIYFDPTNARKG